MKNFITFRQLDFAILKQTGLTEQDVPRSTRQAYVNNKLMKLYAALNWVNDPFFKRVTTLSVAADQETLKDSTGGGVITAVNTTAKTITRSSGTFTAGSLIFVATADTTGVRLAAIARARASSLKAHRSSSEPPPRVSRITS